MPDSVPDPTRTTAAQLAKDVVTLARTGMMPDRYWLTDQRILRACAVLGLPPDEARELSKTWVMELDIDPESPVARATFERADSGGETVIS
jgi:hypothetical protein